MVVRQLDTLSPDATRLHGCGAKGKVQLVRNYKLAILFTNLVTLIHVIDEVIAEVTVFISACYGSQQKNHLLDVRRNMRATKSWKQKVTAMPDLKVLLPNNEAIEQYMDALIQKAIWNSAVFLVFIVLWLTHHSMLTICLWLEHYRV